MEMWTAISISSSSITAVRQLSLIVMQVEADYAGTAAAEQQHSREAALPTCGAGGS